MKAWKILIASAIAGVLLVGTACGNDGADDTAGIDPAAQDTADDGLTPPPTDTADTGAAETLALVTAVDEHEIAMAEQAREKGVEGDVREYADMLHEDHSANLERDRQVASDAGLSLAETDAVRTEKEKGHAVMERLSALEGEAYAEAYVDAMVQGHTDALAMIDERMDTVTDPSVQAHLVATRAAVEGHLEAGQALQGEDAAAAEAASE